MKKKLPSTGKENPLPEHCCRQEVAVDHFSGFSEVNAQHKRENRCDIR